YEPFGSRVDGPPQYNPYQFAGKRLFATLGLYDSRVRQYSPSMGRFLQRDPKGTVDGPNVYTYCGNNPTSYTDPMGQEKVSATLSKSVASVPATEMALLTRNARDALAGAAGAVNVHGESLKGTYYLWSGVDNKQAAESAIASEGGWLMGETPEHVAAVQREMP